MTYILLLRGVHTHITRTHITHEHCVVGDWLSHHPTTRQPIANNSTCVEWWFDSRSPTTTVGTRGTHELPAMIDGSGIPLTIDLYLDNNNSEIQLLLQLLHNSSSSSSSCVSRTGVRSELAVGIDALLLYQYYR